MKRIGHLFEDVVSTETLRHAFYLAAKGKRDRKEVQQFSQDADERIKKLADQLVAGEYTFGRFQQFWIRDPKERLISAPAFEERVIHHAIMIVCEPYFDRWLIDDCYACRKGKGREAAVIRAAELTKRWDFSLHLDVRKYFDSVSHARLKGFLLRRFKDRRLLDLFDRIIRSFRGELGVGLPIGSLTSQHLANFYLGELDRYVKHDLCPAGYVRYMDDLVVWDDDRRKIIYCHGKMMTFLADALSLELKPSSCQATRHGVSFLGCRVFPTHTLLNRRSRLRWQRRIRELKTLEHEGFYSEHELQVRYQSATAFTTAAGVKSWRYRRAVLKRIEVGDREELEPGQPGRQLEQPCLELPVGEP